MTTCPQCGTENLPGMAYCEHCGSPLVAPEQTAPATAGDADAGAAAAIAQAQSVLDQLDAAPPAASAPPAQPADKGAQQAAPADQAAAPPAAPAAPATPGTLSIVFPDGSQYTVSGEVTNVGRSDVAQNWHPELDLIPFGGGAPDLGVSRHQALIQRQDDAYMLVDVGSTNGTFVNGKALEYNKPVELHDGDTVAFGAFNAKVSIR